MAYIGNSPSNIQRGRRAVYEFTATAGQTVFTGVDNNGLTLDLLEYNENDVYLNGSRLVLNDDYTVSGDTLTLLSGAALSDILVIVTQDEVANAGSYTKAESDSRYINYDGDIVNGDLQVVGNITQTGNLSVEGVATVTGANLFVNNNVPTVRVTDTDLTNTYSEFRNVSGNAQIITRADSANGIFSIWANDGSAFTQRLRIENNGDLRLYEDTGATTKLFWDASAESLGIGTTDTANGRSLVVHTPAVVAAGGTQASINNLNGDFSMIGYRSSSLANDSTVRAGAYQDDFAIYTGAAQRFTIDPDGNVGIGAAPNPAAATVKSLRIGDKTHLYDDGGYTIFSNNGYYDGSNRAIVTGESARMYMNAGQFYVQTADSATAGNPLSYVTTLKVDTAGRATTPYQTSFFAYGPSQWINIPSSNTRTSLPSVRHNVGAAWNTSTNEFTAPVDGLYTFSIVATLRWGTGSGGDYNAFFLQRNGVAVEGRARATPPGTNQWCSWTGTWTIKLSAGDIITGLFYAQVANQLQYNPNEMGFSGYLVG